jgi:hypothetical protein
VACPMPQGVVLCCVSVRRLCVSAVCVYVGCVYVCGAVTASDSVCRALHAHRSPPWFWLVVVIVEGLAVVGGLRRGLLLCGWLGLRRAALCSLCHAVSRLVTYIWTPLCPCFL